MSMEIVFQQIFVIFGYMAVGYVAGRCHIIRPAEQKFVSRLITTLILPFTVLSSSNLNMQSNDLMNLAISVIIMFACFLATTICVQLYAKVRKIPAASAAAYTGLCTYPNNAFIGMPLCIALMGEWGTVYGAASMIAFNVLFFTYQVSLFTGEKFSVKSLLTPLNVSTAVLIIMLVFHLRFPEPVQIVVSNIGAITTPLALIVVGVMLANGNLMEVIREKRAYVITAIRNFVIPFIMLGILAVLPLDPVMRMAVLIFVACPIGNMTSVFAIQSDMEPDLCARATLLSTLLFAVSIPVIIAAGQVLIR